MTKQTIGFIGIGRMGTLMSGRLQGAGHTICAFDANTAALNDARNRGAEIASSAREVADRCETVFLSLPTPDVVQSVVLNDVLAGERVKTVVDLSTSGPRTAIAIAAALAKRNIASLDAPVSGGLKGAAEGTLALMVSGPKQAADAVEPLMKNFGKLFYVGEKPGLGQVAKLANNMLAAAALVLTSEVMAMGVKAGIDPAVLLDIINAGTGRNTATTDKFPRSVLTGRFAHGFATGLSYKDVRLCVDEAEAIGIPMIAGAAIREMLAVTNAKYGADSDFTSIARVLEEWAGVEIRSTRPTDPI